MSKSNTILSIRNLDIGYSHSGKDTSVISNIQLEANEGELICFMGPNGVGKSTLIRTLIGAQPALKGEVFIGGNSLHQISNNELARHISVVLTDAISALNMKVHEVISLGRYPYTSWYLRFSAEDKKLIDRAIELTNISDLLDKPMYELSDGQRQKVMIARAICQDTPIMILDEPTAHLDLNNRVEVINSLRTLTQTTQKTVIMATHELDLALQTADKLWLANKNETITSGFPEDLVLNGKIDEVFRFKGYDLKTGRITAYQSNGTVKLKGDGHIYLWTKNALERNGFAIDNNATIGIKILNEKDPKWQIEDNKNELVNSLQDMIAKLRQITLH